MSRCRFPIDSEFAKPYTALQNPALGYAGR
jgi:hypothetical protein